MLTKKEAVAAALTFPDVYEDYPFGDGEWAVMRHKDNRKSFALIYAHEGRIWINVKATPGNCFVLREMFSAVVPAYHMNKQHWVSIILDGSMTDAEITTLLRDSYRLTSSKKSAAPAPEKAPAAKKPAAREKRPRICQSCGMPMPTDDLRGTNADGTSNPDYCKYCFTNGEFIDKVSMEKYIAMCSQYGAQAGMTNEEMKAYCEKLFPTLKRWKNA